MVTNMLRTQIQLTEEQAARLKKIAGARNRSVAKLIREAVDEYLRADVVQSDDEKRRRALKAAGCASSGLGDLAEKHDEYLAEIFDE